ncbi:MAG: ABC transporter ATP-binding protein [Solirubrobacterales bacterium]|nr:ABC transporter ATP-binding protein [Solirubrobacterales bacterium]
MLTKSGAPKMGPLDLSGEAPGGPAAGASVRLDGAGHSYGVLETIERLDLDVAPGAVLGIVGPSGCGKSTLLELIAGLREPSRGTIAVGAETGSDGRLALCAFMPQRDLLLPWLSAIDNAALPLRLAGSTRSQSRERATAPLRHFGLSGFEQTRPQELSGGMRQRVAFLRTLLSGRPALLLDEPFASLDAITRAEMQSWLAGVLSEQPRTVILVTHDVEEALYLCDRVIVLSARPAIAMAEVEVPAPRAEDRAAAVTSPEFASMRAGLLGELGKGASR